MGSTASPHTHTLISRPHQLLNANAKWRLTQRRRQTLELPPTTDHGDRHTMDFRQERFLGVPRNRSFFLGFCFSDDGTATPAHAMCSHKCTTSVHAGLTACTKSSISQATRTLLSFFEGGNVARRAPAGLAGPRPSDLFSQISHPIS